MSDTVRLRDRLVQIGSARPGGRADRQALSDDEAAVWRLLLGWAAAGGLLPSVDPVGNLFLTLPGEDSGRPPILLGGHLDTGPGGGDGAWGLLAALEAVLGLAASGRVPVRDVIVVAWMNACGERFLPGLMGSSTFTGARSLAASRAESDAAGVTVGAAVAARLAAFPGLPRRALGFHPAFYLEAQLGLEDAGSAPIGVVTGLLGRRTWASAAAFRPVVRAWGDEMVALDPAVRFDVGCGAAGLPGALVDLRHPDTGALERLAVGMEALARDRVPCGGALTRLSDDPAIGFDAGLRARIEEAARGRGYASVPVLAGAGHDGRFLAPVCPSALMLVPGHEASGVLAGAEVLADVLWGLALPLAGTGSG